MIISPILGRPSTRHGKLIWSTAPRNKISFVRKPRRPNNNQVRKKRYTSVTLRPASKRRRYELLRFRTAPVESIILQKYINFVYIRVKSRSRLTNTRLPVPRHGPRVIVTRAHSRKHREKRWSLFRVGLCFTSYTTALNDRTHRQLLSHLSGYGAIHPYHLHNSIVICVLLKTPHTATVKFCYGFLLADYFRHCT